MSNALPAANGTGPRPAVGLLDPARAIAGPVSDVVFFWGSPLVSLVFLVAWALLLTRVSPEARTPAIASMSAAIWVLTYAHLVAVMPRAYLNREVFAAHRARLIVAPLVLVAALLASPRLLALGGVVAVFWDVHHSALQTFGLGRIYDAKAGNDPHALRRVDLLLNWVLYVGPIGTGASLVAHFEATNAVARRGWEALIVPPGQLGAWAQPIRALSIGSWIVVVIAAAVAYRAAARRGYRMPVHKAALLFTTAVVSIVAWTFCPPFLAFATVNLFHALQYFALVWLKEGPRMRALVAAGGRGGALTLGLFLLLTGAFGVAYLKVNDTAPRLLGPFVACSLLHFWYDGFVWSVRRRHV